MGTHDDVLKRFQPVLRYDSNEQFFADSAVQYMVNPGNELRRKATARGNGAVIARALPAAGQQTLTLDFLGPKTYGDGSEVREGDLVSVRNKDYREQYRRLRMAHPELKNVVYGHAIEANGRLWLQYWLWYFYNDYQLSLGLGKHEGDWEMVQFRVDPDAGHPDVAVYAQHRYGEVREWDGVEQLGDRPVVYVSRGSHASYFEAGFHQTEAWYDLADGKRRMKSRPALEILESSEPPWTRWPGRWGDTLPRTAVESNSPTGPGAKKQWTAPDRMLDNPPSVSERGKGPRAPEVRALRAGGRLRVEYDVTNRTPRPHMLVVTVNSEDEPGVPPQTHNIPVHSGGHGKVTTDIVLDPLKRHDVHTSTIAGDPPVPSESRRSEIAPFGAQPPQLSLPQRALAAISGAFAAIRGDRR
ncbi:MAG: Vps62-related protein [Actinomycetota bacterium]|nr:Vps62-related protein [Actinomycetota bacterium]